MASPRVAAAFLLLAFGGEASKLQAEGPTAADRCAPALTETGKDEIEELDHSDLMSYYYRKLCQGSGVRVGVSGSSSVVDLLSQASRALGISYENTKQFCEENSSFASARTSSYLHVSRVVDKALENWLTCIRLTNTGIIVEPEFEYDRITLSISRQGRTPGNIAKIETFSQDIRCEGYSISEAGGEVSQVKVDLSAGSVKLSNTEKLNVICSRLSRPDPAVKGAVVYAGGTVSVLTSEGTFNFTVPEEPRGPRIWANEIKVQLALLQKEVNELRATLARRSQFGHTDDTTKNQVNAYVPGLPASQFISVTNGAAGYLVCPSRRVAVGLSFDGKGGVTALCTPLGWIDSVGLFSGEAATP